VAVIIRSSGISVITSNSFGATTAPVVHFFRKRNWSQMGLDTFIKPVSKKEICRRKISGVQANQPTSRHEANPSRVPNATGQPRSQSLAGLLNPQPPRSSDRHTYRPDQQPGKSLAPSTLASQSHFTLRVPWATVHTHATKYQQGSSRKHRPYRSKVQT
jgi:hypothetical protein